jgi:hypothetical protein
MSGSPLDPRAPARPTDPDWYDRRVEVVLYLVAGLTYVGLAMFHKFLLNWIIGPVWLVAWVWLAPALLESVRRRTRRGEGP